MHSTTTRRRLGAGALIAGAAFLAIGAFAPAAQAGDPEPGPAVFGAGYDSYLNENQRGLSDEGIEGSESCPTDDAVDELTAWHFVMSANTHDFASLDVAFTLGGTNVTMSNLTPVAKPTDPAGWAAFDPDTQFIADPDGKHAYVYTDSDGGVVRDAAAQDSPDSAGPKFQLSHVCTGPGTGTDGSTDGGTTTGSAGTTTGTADTTTGDALPNEEVADPKTEVAGEVVTRPETLPRTGDNDRSLFLIGMGLVTIGAVAMIARRELFIRS